MTTQTPERVYVSEHQGGGDGFGALVHAEWTKFRTVRGWVIGMLVAATVIVLVGVMGPLGSHVECHGPAGNKCANLQPPKGPDGEGMRDDFTFVHRTLTGDGTITARISSLTGRYPSDPGVPDGPLVDGLQPWSKGGLIIKDGLTQGSAYAAILATADHGVRMQYDFTHDRAGLPGPVSSTAPRWLRLVRAGDTVTGYDSVDGATWIEVGKAKLAGLPASVEIGLFSASPEYDVMTTGFGGTTGAGGPSFATATFDQVALRGAVGGTDWTGSQVSDAVGAPPAGPNRPTPGFQQSAGTFTVTGSGDIAPDVIGRDNRTKTVSSALVGAFAGLIAAVVVGAMFMTSEYRRGLIRTTLTASPRRGRVLAAKALVLGAVTFLVGLVAGAVAVPVVSSLERSRGLYVIDVPLLSMLRVIGGTAALLAVAAVFALAVGCIVRRSAPAVAVVILAVVLPYILAVASVLPTGPAQWLARLTPAAAFAIQQTVTKYPQVTASYAPADGYFPLPPWAGFAVLCAYAAASLALAAYLLRRRDA